MELIFDDLVNGTPSASSVISRNRWHSGGVGLRYPSPIAIVFFLYLLFVAETSAKIQMH